MVAELIQVFKLSGQVSREAHKPRTIGFGVLGPEANEPSLDVNAIPPQT
jgi:hypothetical protein